MKQFKRSPLHSGVFAVAASAAALLLTVLTRPYLDPESYVLFILAAWASAWFYGRTGGLISTAASAVAILVFFLRPDPAATAFSWGVLLRLTAFVLAGAVVTWMT